jgi:Tol biopolymer transport system component
VKLSEAAIRGGRLLALRIAPRGGRVVYAADQDTDELVELYSVPIDGSAAPVKLSGIQVPGGDVTTPLVITPDGERVAYAADGSVDGLTGIYSVPLDGSAPPVELFRPRVGGFGLLQDLRLTPDGKRVTFLADHDDDGSFDLFGASMTRGRARRLNGRLVSGGSVSGYALGPNGLVYRADQDADEVFELYRTPLDAPFDGREPPVRLHVPLGPDTDVQAGFVLSPDGAHVVFAADARRDEVVELFTVPFRSSSAVPQPLHAPFVAGADVVADVPENIAITSDSERVLFAADGETDEVFEVFESPLPSGTPGRVRQR